MHVADAIVVEAQRALAKGLSPANVELLTRVANGAVRYKVDLLVTLASDTRATDVPAALKRRRKSLDAQLANLKAYASDAATQTFWASVDRVFDRLAAFMVPALLAAV